jgi:hypothetical protein
VIFAAIKQAAEIDYVSISKMNFASIQKAAVHLHCSSSAKAAEPARQIKFPQRARRDAAKPMIVKVGRQTACKNFHIHVML